MAKASTIRPRASNTQVSALKESPMSVMAFVTLMLQLRDEFPISCSGWWRTPARNKKVGGVPNSRHLAALGMDIVRDRGCDKAALLARIRSMGLQAVDEPDHIHVEVP